MKQRKNVAGNWIRIRMWFGGYKQAALVGTILSLIRNMIKGVRAVSTSSLPCLFAQSRECVGLSFLSARLLN